MSDATTEQEPNARDTESHVTELNIGFKLTVNCIMH